MNLLNLTHNKSKVKWWTILSLFGILLAFSSCQKEDCPEEEIEPAEEYPSLMIVNQNTDNRVITYVSFVGYDFSNLNIDVGDSQTFTLENGMPGGYNDINVKVGYTNGYKSIEVNFSDGDITTITLKGCISSEGCDGLYLEYIP